MPMTNLYMSKVVHGAGVTLLQNFRDAPKRRDVCHEEMLAPQMRDS